MKRLMCLVLAACAPSAKTATVTSEPTAVVHGVGVRTLEGKDPITGGALPIAVVFPAQGQGATPTQFGPYEVQAAAGLEVAPGRWPMVVISHGHGGSLWGHHDLAEALARAGYVAAMVEHVGDSWQDQSGFRSDRTLLGRAYQVTATIDRVLSQPGLAEHVDHGRIGVAGFSAGGYTALLVVGAQPDFARVAGYCERHPDDQEICGGPAKLELTPAQKRPTRDPRVTAAFAMAPFAVVFGPDAFRGVTAPVFLAWASEDKQLLPDENARAILPALTTLAGEREIAGAGHFVFLPPCEPALAQAIPAMCADTPGVDRAKVHAELAADAVGFFNARLGAKPRP
jgi:predicted dienelactone hydrolase